MVWRGEATLLFVVFVLGTWGTRKVWRGILDSRFHSVVESWDYFENRSRVPGMAVNVCVGITVSWARWAVFSEVECTVIRKTKQ